MREDVDGKAGGGPEGCTRDEPSDDDTSLVAFGRPDVLGGTAEGTEAESEDDDFVDRRPDGAPPEAFIVPIQLQWTKREKWGRGEREREKERKKERKKKEKSLLFHAPTSICMAGTKLTCKNAYRNHIPHMHIDTQMLVLHS